MSHSALQVFRTFFVQMLIKLRCTAPRDNELQFCILQIINDDSKPISIRMSRKNRGNRVCVTMIRRVSRAIRTMWGADFSCRQRKEYKSTTNWIVHSVTRISRRSDWVQKKISFRERKIFFISLLFNSELPADVLE